MGTYTDVKTCMSRKKCIHPNQGNLTHEDYYYVGTTRRKRCKKCTNVMRDRRKTAPKNTNLTKKEMLAVTSKTLAARILSRSL